jgi:superfamily II DNA or RNA helicase
MDFDGENWVRDVGVLRKVCEAHDIPQAVERSRSGNGAHAWFFFSETVSATVAREFGSALLTAMMELHHGIKFASYDRLFPSQDTMPKGGFGNLIALPLQRKARDKNNSVFIDEHGKPYEDQWALLSRLRHLSTDELNKHIAMLSKNGELGPLRTESDENAEKPWQKKKPVKLTVRDFPAEVKIVKANMLYMDKEGFSARALNRLKRTAAFSNPVFYRKQAVRESIRDTPRIISCSSETDQYLCLPRGCKNDVIAILEATQILWKDERNKGRSIDVEFNGVLRLDQGMALAELKSHENGILAATTGFGKTVVAISLIAQYKINTLILVDRLQLLEQWMTRLDMFLTINETLPELPEESRKKKQREIIGSLSGGKNNLSGIIDVATYQSLVRGDEVKDLVKDYGMIIVDECHHVAAVNYERVLKEANANFVYGLTATPRRQDGHHPIVFMQCGDIRYKVDAKLEAENRPFEHCFIPRFTPYKLPIDKEDMKRHQIYEDLCKHEPRNDMIIADILQAISEGRNPLVLSDLKVHINLLQEALIKSIPNLIVLTGGKSQKESKRLLEKVASVPEGEPLVIIATGKYIGEGFDEPRLDTLFLTMPFSWEGTLSQYVGRLHRLHYGKDEVHVYDYVDAHVPMLESMYAKRVRGYAAIGYGAKCEGVIPAKENIIYDCSSFLPVYTADLLAAKREVVIVSPYLTQTRISKMVDVFDKCILSGTNVKVVTRSVEDNTDKDFSRVSSLIRFLREKGITVIEKPKIHQKFAIIDDRIIWYGSINLLSFGKSEESIMRLESSTIAGELTNIVRE